MEYRRFFWLLVCAWTAAVGGSLIWGLVDRARDTRALMVAAARGLLERDVLYREWSILHGGVYVPKSSQPESPSYPNDENREIVTLAGQKLTLLNPALVSRQIFERQKLAMGIKGHLTSLKPLRAANAPDAWEQKGLQDFERGVEEVSSVDTEEGTRYFRLMRPLVTVSACLNCHEEQGRQPGQIRGGISAAVPISKYAAPGRNLALASAYLSLWGLGMAGLIVGGKDLSKQIRSRQRAEDKLGRLVKELTESMAKVKTLTGLIPICSSCKKIRDDRGDWTHLETYLKANSDAQFSHGICLDCLRTLYPDFPPESELSPGTPPGGSMQLLEPPLKHPVQ